MLLEQVKKAMQLTGSIMIQKPNGKFAHRVPCFKENGEVWVKLYRGNYKVVGYKKLDILDIFEVQ